MDPSKVSVDEAPAGHLQIENPTLEDEIEAGPIGEQLEVVVLNQLAVCGGDNPPELREYERLSERKIKEMNEAKKEAMEEIDEAKEDMRVNAPGAKKRMMRRMGEEEEEEGGGLGGRDSQSAMWWKKTWMEGAGRGEG